VKPSLLRSLFFLAGLLSIEASAARALVFQEYVDSGGNHVLVARDCKNFSEGIEPWDSFDKQHGCRGGAEDEGVTDANGTYLGDGAVLDFILSMSEGRGNAFSSLRALAGGIASDAGTAQTVAAQQRSPHAFAEVWLNSGGGDVDAGVAMARVLRRHGMTVRLPQNYHCISACTLTFMGGVLRYMEPGATFQVHSASVFLEGVGDTQRAMLKKDPDQTLRLMAMIEQVDARYTAIRDLTLFQNTLLVPTRSPQQPENDADFCAWAGGQWASGCRLSGQARLSTHFSYVDDDNRERADDVERIRREGEAAYQDILMRVEREAMALAISDLEAALPQRGPRAKPALEMLRAMYMTSIKDTSYLTPDQMITMGYLTPVFRSGKK
jgi:hypothetical protein